MIMSILESVIMSKIKKFLSLIISKTMPKIFFYNNILKNMGPIWEPL